MSGVMVKVTVSPSSASVLSAVTLPCSEAVIVTAYFVTGVLVLLEELLESPLDELDEALESLLEELDELLWSLLEELAGLLESLLEEMLDELSESLLLEELTLDVELEVVVPLSELEDEDEPGLQLVRASNAAGKRTNNCFLFIMKLTSFVLYRI